MVLGGKVHSSEWQYFGEVVSRGGRGTERWDRSCGRRILYVSKHYEAPGVMRQWIELMGSGSDAAG